LNVKRRCTFGADRSLFVKGTDMIPRWQIDGDRVLDPDGHHVSTITPGLSSIRRREFIERLLDAPRKAYQRGCVDGSEGEVLLDPPDDLK
jgi:hypothetical protein